MRTSASSCSRRDSETTGKNKGGILLSKQDVIEVEGIVTEAYPNAMFEVKLPNDHKIDPAAFSAESDAEKQLVIGRERPV